MNFICPESGLVNCLLCTGEACDYCGAGCWNNGQTNCQHDVATRHQPSSDKINFMRLPLDSEEWTI